MGGDTLGIRSRTRLIPLAAMVGLLAWGAVTAATSGRSWQDPVMWQLALLASVVLDLVLLMDCEWSAREAVSSGTEDPATGNGDARGLGLSAILLLVLQVGVLLAFQWSTDLVLVVCAAGLVVANLVIAYAIRRSLAIASRRHESSEGETRQPRAGSAESYGVPWRADPPAPFVVACSGGGIRASAFVLGGINAVQSVDRGPWASPGASPRLVAVSGGSYTAAAMALTRSFGVDEDGAVTTLADRIPWTQVYRDGTPELRRLRRHTRDLLEPRSELVLGLAALLLGAALNVFLAIASVRLLAWVIAWTSTRAGDLRLSAPCTGSFCSIFDGWGGGRLWWTDESIAVWALLTVVSVVVGVWLWIVQGRINRLRRNHIPAADGRRRDRLRSIRSATQYAAAGWFLAFIALPGLVAALNHVALDNAPTPAVAALVSGLGFATPGMCEQAGGRSMVEAVTAAAAAARISPGEKRSAHGGACGVDTEVTITLQAQASTCSLSPGPSTCPTAPEEWRALGVALVRAEHPRGGHSLTKIGGSLVAFLALLQTLRASVTVDDAVTGHGASRLRRVLLMRLPMVVVLLVSLWLLGRWVFQAAVVPAAAHSVSQTLLPLAGLLAATFVDANVTSMHEFYRGRLASAFAAGRTGDGAEELDPRRFYRFSDLTDLPLTIATTANVQAYESVPTRRGGAPVTFDNRNVSLFSGLPETSRTVDVKRYEEAVGYGYASVMSIVAMSGAAVSPLMGRYAATVGPFRLLLALFNIRVGVWVPNPRFAPPESMVGHDKHWRKAVRQWPARPWFTGRPGAGQVAKEAFGRSSFDDQWLYLTDGGHLDNTGLVESVRIALGEVSTLPGGWRQVLALDASNDKEGTWAAVGDALGVIRADLGVRLERQDGQQWTFGTPQSGSAQRVVRTALGRRRTETDERSEPDFARLYVDEARRIKVLVVKAVRPVDLDHARLPDSVRAFAMATADFPRASTGRQDFSDLEFEAYRELGEWCTLQAIRVPTGT